MPRVFDRSKTSASLPSFWISSEKLRIDASNDYWMIDSSSRCRHPHDFE